MGPSDIWRARASTAEAIALLVVARLLVAKVGLARWRSSLGRPSRPEAGDPSLRLPANLVPRRLARAVERAARRLPGENLCLAQAMALQWMLRRRRLGGMLVIGVRPALSRGGLDDLHAWVVRQGEVLIGATAEPHHPIFAAGV